MHDAGGLLYYDGANLNAILGKVRPGDMGFDVIHMNLHKTFSTPHGGGGPGAGAVGVERAPAAVPADAGGGPRRRALPLARRDATCRRPSAGCRRSWATPACCCAPTSTCACSAARACTASSEFATLNANYLMARLTEAGFELAYPGRRAGHEFIITLRREARDYGMTAMDFAKRLLDYGFHAPTTYFPLLVPSAC